MRWTFCRVTPSRSATRGTVQVPSEAALRICQRAEQEAMPAIWRYCDDGALTDRVLRPFIASRTREDIADDLRLEIGSVSPREELQLLGPLLAR
jgi:hypothetical protein